MPERAKSFKLGGAIHDVRYLFAGIRAVLLLSLPVHKDEIVESVRKEVLEYNQSIAERYNLSKPRSISSKLASDIVTELRALGVIELEEGKYKFSRSGEYLASLLKDKRTKEFRDEMTKLIIDRFPQLTSFLTALYELTKTGELLLPKVTTQLFNEICNQDTTTMAKRIVDGVSISLQAGVGSKLNVDELKRRLDLCLEKAKGGKIQSLGVEADRYLISKVFGPHIVSKRTFDVMRDRCESMFLVNYGTFFEGASSSEIVYLTSWIVPGMMPPSGSHGFDEIYLENRRKILIHNPSGPFFHTRFAEVVTHIYKSLPSQFGFVSIGDLRNHACKELRISDRLFDSEITRLYEEKPQKIGLSYSFEKITSKRLPIVMGDTMKAIYNIISIKE